jgi:hypothetical protein
LHRGDIQIREQDESSVVASARRVIYLAVIFHLLEKVELDIQPSFESSQKSNSAF